MEKFYIRYHVAGDKFFTDIREFESFGDAVVYAARKMDQSVIAVIKNDGHVIEIQTNHITHHEVMTLEVAEKELALAQLRLSAKNNSSW